MERWQRLAERWASREMIEPGVTLNLPEGPALVLDKGPGQKEWWAWSVDRQEYVVVRDHSKGKQDGWYEYRNGSGAATVERIA
jgi:hypothetical protein